MIENAPIWLNELFVKSISIIVTLASIFGIIFIIYIVKGFYYKFKEKRRLNKCFTRKKFVVYSIVAIISSVIIIIFYYPKQVLPNNYNIYDINISINSIANQKRLSITDKSTLKELECILEEYTCKRSFDSGRTVINDQTTKVIFLDMFLLNNNIKQSISLHFIIEKDKQRVYTSGNTDFIYIISNHDGMLTNKILDFVERRQ